MGKQVITKKNYIGFSRKARKCPPPPCVSRSRPQWPRRPQCGAASGRRRGSLAFGAWGPRETIYFAPPSVNFNGKHMCYIYVSLCLYIYLYLSIYLSICLSVYLSIYLSIYHLCIYLFIYFFVNSFRCLCMCIFIYIYIYYMHTHMHIYNIHLWRERERDIYIYRNRLEP